MKILFQFRWYEFVQGDIYHYYDVSLPSLKNSAKRFGERHGWRFHTSLTSAIVERTL
jgi:hypothetical protein